MSKDYEFEEVENLPILKRNKTGLYKELLDEFKYSGKSTVRLNWKGKAALNTVAVSLRKVVKANPSLNILVTSRSKINPANKKRIVYEIYLSKKEETGYKKKGK